jgi:hypothetical protein
MFGLETAVNASGWQALEGGKFQKLNTADRKAPERKEGRAPLGVDDLQQQLLVGKAEP